MLEDESNISDEQLLQFHRRIPRLTITTGPLRLIRTAFLRSGAIYNELHGRGSDKPLYYSSEMFALEMGLRATEAYMFAHNFTLRSRFNYLTDLMQDVDIPVNRFQRKGRYHIQAFKNALEALSLLEGEHQPGQIIRVGFPELDTTVRREQMDRWIERVKNFAVSLSDALYPAKFPVDEARMLINNSLKEIPKLHPETELLDLLDLAVVQNREQLYIEARNNPSKK